MAINHTEQTEQLKHRQQNNYVFTSDFGLTTDNMNSNYSYLKEVTDQHIQDIHAIIINNNN